jgi:hypothetical protein
MVPEYFFYFGIIQFKKGIQHKNMYPEAGISKELLRNKLEVELRFCPWLILIKY